MMCEVGCVLSVQDWRRQVDGGAYLTAVVSPPYRTLAWVMDPTPRQAAGKLEPQSTKHRDRSCSGRRGKQAGAER